MGEEIQSLEFSEDDFIRFHQRLREETRLLGEWMEAGRFANAVPCCGLELEAWLTTPDYAPSPSNKRFLDALNHPLVGTELSQFNFELNSTPQKLGEGGAQSLTNMHKELDDTWAACVHVSEGMDLHAITIGSIPTLEDNMLTLETMSKGNRYQAMNQQLFRLQDGEPTFFSIEEGETLYVEKADIMLEAASTSLQVHFQVPQAQALRVYNASIIASAPLVAASANSPYLYGKQLWDETRIAIFERAVPGGNLRGCDGHPIRRVSFGSSYAKESLLEPFQENINGYPPILPVLEEDKPLEALTHLKLHNGTVWRWNRPLVGTDAISGKPSLRIEHRAMSAGPSNLDTVANIAFYLGLANALAKAKVMPSTQLSFDDARRNFYHAAIHGLSAELTWLDGKVYPVRELVLNTLLPMAKEGLQALGIADDAIACYLDGVIRPRLTCGQNGAEWQKAYIRKYGRDFKAMTKAYAHHQSSGKAVHEWEV